MKGVVLAGGLGTRLLPLTRVTNKHLLPIGNIPMIYHPINKMIQSGITDIMIVTGVEHCGAIMSLLGSGDQFNCSFTYKVQDKPDGIAGALKLCRNFVGEGKFLVILGDNIFEDNILKQILKFKKSDSECMLFFKEVENPQRFGVAKFNNGKIIEVIEKPEVPPSSFACVGIYLYSSKVFEYLDRAKKSDRDEYEISNINSELIKKDKVDFAILKGIWTDAGTFDSYEKTNKIFYKKLL